MAFIATLMGIIGFGILHGINPSHGWPVASLYAMRSSRPLFWGVISSSIISVAHMFSSVAVVIAYILLVNNLGLHIPGDYMKYGSAVALGLLAYLFWKEKGEDLVKTQHGHLHDGTISSTLEHYHSHWHSGGLGYHIHTHTHQRRASPPLKSIISFAFILGFVHEEEFVILAIAASQSIDPILLIIAYSISVSAALIGITTISLKFYQEFQLRVIQYARYLPKISALFLIFMSVGIVIGII
jgi:nickel/cobalt exporter